MRSAAEPGSLEFVISAAALQNNNYVQQDSEDLLDQTASLKSKSPESFSRTILHSDLEAPTTCQPHHNKCHCPRTVKSLPTLVITIGELAI